jgi:hypothetical protein
MTSDEGVIDPSLNTALNIFLAMRCDFHKGAHHDYH